MKPELKERMISFAEAVDVLVIEAHRIHADLIEEGVWGTGVTASMPGRLYSVSHSAQVLAELDGKTR